MEYIDYGLRFINLRFRACARGSHDLVDVYQSLLAVDELAHDVQERLRGWFTAAFATWSFTERSPAGVSFARQY
jgi:hypothetical protein